MSSDISLILEEVDAELYRARKIHGRQHRLPLGFGDRSGGLMLDLLLGTDADALDSLPNSELEEVAKAICQIDPTWAKITFEEFAEALAAGTREETRAELVQLAAMAVGSISALDAQAARDRAIEESLRA